MVKVMRIKDLNTNPTMIKQQSLEAIKQLKYVDSIVRYDVGYPEQDQTIVEFFCFYIHT